MSTIDSGKFALNELPVDGAWLIEGKIFEDERGFFTESYNQTHFESLGLPRDWAQVNVSLSHKNVIRGLHSQTRAPQGKLIRCLQGQILDVVVDCRPRSPSFGAYFSVKLNGGDGNAIYVPPGCLHGFSVTGAFGLVEYMTTTPYDPKSDGGVRYDDPYLDIDWEVKTPILSMKDRGLGTFGEWVKKLQGELECH